MQSIPTLADIVGSGRKVANHGPCPRAEVDTNLWQRVTGQLAASQWTLSGLWGDTAAVHMALLDEPAAEMIVVSLACPDGRFPSVAQQHPPAIRLERTIRDLFGLEPENAPDPRPWLDHGRWGVRHPLGTKTMDVLAPSCSTACATVSKTGMPLTS